ncbi:hypothetical protein ACFX13_012773 [Malus domestica]
MGMRHVLLLFDCALSLPYVLSSSFNSLPRFQTLRTQNHRLLLHQFTQTTATTSPKSDERCHNKRVNLPAPPVSATFSKTRLTEEYGSKIGFFQFLGRENRVVTNLGINQGLTAGGFKFSDELLLIVMLNFRHEASREFSSAPISKRFDIFTLETVDGVCVAIRGFINEQNTI